MNKEHDLELRTNISSETPSYNSTIIRKLNLVIKRTIDVAGCIIGLIILSPLFLVISILIKTSSKGSIFFLQERLGKDLKIFKIIKFRTMITNAEKIGDGLFVYGENDIRITKIGRFLRKTSIDELPQLFNIIRGDMSLVGPRPPVTYHPYKANEYDSLKKRRFEMRPGITGIAQVSARNSAIWDERIEYDIKYINNFNVFLDIKIIFMTLREIFEKKNIYISLPGQNEKVQN